MMKVTHSDHATLKRRVGAYFCDQAIIWFGHSILYSVFFHNFMPSLQHFPWRAREQIFDTFADSSSLTFTMCFLAYYMIAPWIGGGQTIGQRLFGMSIAINNRKKNVSMAPPHLEVLSYILRGMVMLFIQTTYGLPFLLHFISKDGRGLQDWCSFSNVSLREKGPNFTVIYAEHVASSSEEQGSNQLIQYPSEVQLTLPLDLKNPSILQLYPNGFNQAGRKKAA